MIELKEPVQQFSVDGNVLRVLAGGKLYQLQKANNGNVGLVEINLQVLSEEDLLSPEVKS